MTQPARLRALRLVGFKSFAERTLVEFGPGISAVVGPNGSGKSNLADALRWTMGEQGRLLRTRRSEDVIFAGSSSRRAIGMADVTLVLENSDRLLPLDYAEVEIGRRLYRSGENEYLLNRQRVRLRDLAELLDAANLADNAFLFIGQGMVDQALALRPEERRPLFEEAAGVRRHERRRRHAEVELTEAEANLERLRDLLAELRPQARRLAAQAEQLQARQTAGLELAGALVAAARQRWVVAARSAAENQRALEAAHTRADAELGALRAAEEAAEHAGRALAEQAEQEGRLRFELDRRRAATVELRLAQARLASDAEALERERRRLEAERTTLEERSRSAQQRLAQPVAEVNVELRLQLAALERDLAGVESELDGLAGDHPADAPRRMAAGVAAELEQQRARLVRLEQKLTGQRTRLTQLERDEQAAEATRRRAIDALDAARLAEGTAEAALQAARVELERCSAGAAVAANEQVAAEANLAAAGARLAALQAAVEAATDDSLLRAARARGGRLIGEGLEVEPGLRRAVSAVLGDTLRGLIVAEGAVEALRGQTGTLLVDGGLPRRLPPAAQAAAEALVAGAVALGGDRLTAAIRRDPQGHVTRLVARSVWLPELADALSLRTALPAGWRAVTRAGEVVSDEGLIQLAGGEAALEQRAALDDGRKALAGLESQLADARGRLAEAQRAQQSAQEAWERARSALDAARRERRLADEAERSSQRRAEACLRERSWEAAQLERAEAERSALAGSVDQLEARFAELSTAEAAPGRTAEGRRRQLADERQRLQERRLELGAELSADEQAARSDEEARRRAEVGLALADSRGAELETEFGQLAVRGQEQATAGERLVAELAAAEEQERRATVELEALLGQEAHDRRQLLDAEHAASEARERLRLAEASSRTAEVAAMEARLQLEQVREQLLVELAGIGHDGLRALRDGDGDAEGDSKEGGDEHGTAPNADDVEPVPAETLGSELEAALERAIERWNEATEQADVPGPGRLAALRRRFHDLGAGNPFAVEEYAELRQRLDGLEAQREDLETAMDNTRQLIANLNRLITEQFLSTFAALEGAFARRFEQLFGGGEAQLSLTQPEDLSSTGVEITARPPGKKRQPLAMLSGGERALTAVALLLAMLEVRPVPFCVLDEVDAALDEANIGRFSAALRGLADRIQFIVITHNRGTIEAADTLYGVTIGDDAVSRIVSLRLPPADDNGRAATIPIEPALETLGS